MCTNHGHGTQDLAAMAEQVADLLNRIKDAGGQVSVGAGQLYAGRNIRPMGPDRRWTVVTR